MHQTSPYDLASHETMVEKSVRSMKILAGVIFRNQYIEGPGASQTFSLVVPAKCLPVARF